MKKQCKNEERSKVIMNDSYECDLLNIKCCPACNDRLNLSSQSCGTTNWECTGCHAKYVFVFEWRKL